MNTLLRFILNIFRITGKCFYNSFQVLILIPLQILLCFVFMVLHAIFILLILCGCLAVIISITSAFLH
jgi:hypothetical protein